MEGLIHDVVVVLLLLGVPTVIALADQLPELLLSRAKRKAPRRALAGCKCERCEAHRKAFGDWSDSGRVEVSRPTQEAR